MEWETKKLVNQKIRKQGNQEMGKRGNEKTRKRGNEERPEAEGNTVWEGDKAPNLMNIWYPKNRSYFIPIYSQVACRPLYKHDRLTTQILIVVCNSPKLFLVLVHLHAIPNLYFCN